MTTNPLTTCCESSGRTLTDSGAAASAQTPVYCPVYESRLLATARHELNSAAALGMYGSPYATSQGYGNYVTYGADPSAFYSLVSHPLITTFTSMIEQVEQISYPCYHAGRFSIRSAVDLGCQLSLSFQRGCVPPRSANLI